MIHHPPRCKCGAVLVRHCPDTNPTCPWWRCKNTGCVWDIVDIVKGRRADKQGNVEQDATP